MFRSQPSPAAKVMKSTNIPSRWLPFQVTRPLSHCLQNCSEVILAYVHAPFTFFLQVCLVSYSTIDTDAWNDLQPFNLTPVRTNQTSSYFKLYSCSWTGPYSKKRKLSSAFSSDMVSHETTPLTTSGQNMDLSVAGSSSRHKHWTAVKRWMNTTALHVCGFFTACKKYWWCRSNLFLFPYKDYQPCFLDHSTIESRRGALASRPDCFCWHYSPVFWITPCTPVQGHTSYYCMDLVPNIPKYTFIKQRNTLTLAMHSPQTHFQQVKYTNHHAEQSMTDRWQIRSIIQLWV